MKILVLCTGNSCRSQMAEGWLRSWNGNMTVVSAGTKPAEQVNGMAVEVMAEVGIDIGGAKPKDLEAYIGENWDFVITVCGKVAEGCPRFEGTVGRQVHLGVDDPAEARGTEEFIRKEFRRVRDELQQRLVSFYIQEVQERELRHCECNIKKEN